MSRDVRRVRRRTESHGIGWTTFRGLLVAWILALVGMILTQLLTDATEPSESWLGVTGAVTCAFGFNLIVFRRQLLAVFEERMEWGLPRSWYRGKPYLLILFGGALVLAGGFLVYNGVAGR